MKYFEYAAGPAAWERGWWDGLWGPPETALVLWSPQPEEASWQGRSRLPCLICPVHGRGQRPQPALCGPQTGILGWILKNK